MKAQCGTYSGYAKHLREKTPTCEECREANRLRMSRYYRKNPKKIYEINRRWAAKNPEKVKQYSRRIFAKRKAQKLGTRTEKYTESQVLELYGAVCHICNLGIDLDADRKPGKEGWQMGLQIDHVTPLSKNGTDTIDNVRPSHVICNMLKKDTVN